MDSCSISAVLGGLFLVGYGLYYILHVRKRGYCYSDRDLTGATVLITGGNTGIGLETALDMAKRHARVIIACRDPMKGEQALNLIIRESGNNNVALQLLDLSSLSSVRNFARDFKMGEQRLDILINSAGCIGTTEKRLTVDGLEMTMGTNHFGHFLLTNLLLDMLVECSPSRVVVVSSIVQFWGSINFDNLNFEKSYNGGSAYCNSKLANVLFVKELHRQYHDKGVSVYSLHPGSVRTELLRSLPLPLKLLFDYLISPLFFRSAREGAQTSIYCAVEADIEHLSGKYFSECRVADEGSKARDDATARKLWEISESITGLF